MPVLHPAPIRDGGRGGQRPSRRDCIRQPARADLPCRSLYGILVLYPRCHPVPLAPERPHTSRQTPLSHVTATASVAAWRRRYPPKPCRFCRRPCHLLPLCCRFLPLLPPITRNVKLPRVANR